MAIYDRLSRFFLGKPKNPLSLDTQRHIVLIAFLAWIGLGADGLSSSCYGPEEAFIALGANTGLALYVALATVITVFVIALAYNQVIELFPSGGGGYKVASELLGSYAGLVSGAALIVDYVLTISISTASGMDALFSFLPVTLLPFKLLAEAGLIVFLMVLNMRGMKESIKMLTPIFLGFVVTHAFLIIYGITGHKSSLPSIFLDTISETKKLSEATGWFFVLALILRSYSLGSGTYTGIEAVSNNINRLAEPRIRTGKWTMFYMAVSLSFTAGGIMLLYLLWHAQPIHGQTLNAVVFHNILGDSAFAKIMLIITLLLEAGLLFVGANTGFLAGPGVLANMAVDGWVPNRFRHLSSRLVTQNGVIVFGLAALAILWISRGHVSWLVVLYSINVFLTFSMSILGLCVYWCKKPNRQKEPSFQQRTSQLCRFLFSLFALLITASILIITLYSKFAVGGWVTIAITSMVVILCLITKKHYVQVEKKLREADTLLITPSSLVKSSSAAALKPQEPTAAIMVGRHQGVAMHSLFCVLRMFPNHFKNFVFLSVGIVDVESFRGQAALEEMEKRTNKQLKYFVDYCQAHGLAAKTVQAFGTDPAEKLIALSKEVIKEFPETIFFANKLIFDSDNWLARFLHNETAITVQRGLHAFGAQLVIVPMKV